jgi:hypothetical protein
MVLLLVQDSDLTSVTYTVRADREPLCCRRAVAKADVAGENSRSDDQRRQPRALGGELLGPKIPRQPPNEIRPIVGEYCSIIHRTINWHLVNLAQRLNDSPVSATTPDFVFRRAILAQTHI